MLKHEELIRKLTEGQKIALLTKQDALSAPWLVDLGIPKLNISDFDTVLTDYGGIPSAQRAAYSWNKELMRTIANCAAANMFQKGSSVLITPDLSVAIGKNAKGLSEDACLSGELGKAICDGIESGGVVPAVGNIALSQDNVLYLDKQPQDTVLQEIILRPYKLALGKAQNRAILTSVNRLSGAYESVNAKQIRGFLRHRFPNIPVICDKATLNDTSEGFANGNLLCLNGSEDALSVGLENYRKMSVGMQMGTIPFSEVAKAEETGSAISQESLDEAVDKVISFMFECAAQQRGTASARLPVDVLKNIYAESTVLLKNDGVLPLKRGTKVSVIGHLDAGCDFVGTFSRSCEQNGCSFVGYAKGYELEEEIGHSELTKEALSIAEKSDIALVILNETADSGKLSANRLELLSEIFDNTSCKIVGVMLTDNMDVGFAPVCSGIVLTDVSSHEAGQVFSDILFGAISPSGKLTKTMYKDRNKYFAELRSRRNDAKRKIGRLYGYRFCDTLNYEEGFPFGHGLTYSKVTYKSMTMDGASITVSLINNGKSSVMETVQVYFGKNNSACVVPKKSLVAFVKVTLAAGEKKDVVVPLMDLKSKLKIYDPAAGKLVLEDGVYDIYVGSSVKDIRIQSKVELSGVTFEEQEKREPYFGSTSNIIDGGYRLQGSLTDRKKFFKKFALGFSIVTLLIDLIMLYCLFEYSDLKVLCIILISILSATMVGVDMAFGIKKAKDKKLRRAEAAAIRLCREQWEMEEIKDELPLQEMFVVQETAVEEEDTSVKDEAALFVSRGMKFSTVCDELTKHLADSGIVIKREDARSVLASIASTRLLVFRNNDATLLNAFLEDLSLYFGGASFVSDASNFENVGSLLDQEKGIVQCLDYADNNRTKMVFQVLKNVDMRSVSKYFIQLTRYLGNPSHGHNLEYETAEGTVKRVIPSNVWFILVEDALRPEFPVYISEFAAVVNLSLRQGAKADSPAWLEPPLCEEFLWATNIKRGGMEVGELMWKKVDSLEHFVHTQAAYSIENKKWGQLERFVAVYMACSEENEENALDDALDRAVAAELIIGMSCALIGNMENSKHTFLEIVEKSLGEDKVTNCTNVLKSFEAKGIAR